MMSEQDWVDRLGRQWAVLRTYEDRYMLDVRDGKDPAATDLHVKRLASDYGRMVRDAPTVALLRHASELKRTSLR